MLRSYIKWILFISSYVPLYIILLFINRHNVLATCLLSALIIITIILVWIILITVNSLEKKFLKIKKVENKNGEFVGYIFTYILPFLSSDFSNIDNIIVTLFLFLLVGLLYVKSDLLHINPLLNILGYSLYEMEDNKENTLLIITKRKNIKKGDTIKTLSISNNIHIGE